MADSWREWRTLAFPPGRHRIRRCAVQQLVQDEGANEVAAVLNFRQEGAGEGVICRLVAGGGPHADEMVARGYGLSAVDKGESKVIGRYEIGVYPDRAQGWGLDAEVLRKSGCDPFVGEDAAALGVGKVLYGPVVSV